MTLGMMQSGQTVKTRPAPSSHEVWKPLPYMDRAAWFLESHYAAGLPLKPGGRKTSITLEAFRRLKADGKVKTMLVVAPLRVCRQVWRQEGKKWTQFRDIEFALLHGSKKKKALESGADIYLINPEGLKWLCQLYMGRPLPFDIVCIDELTKFKNGQSERHKFLRPRLKGVKYRWGLTGSLFAKGHMGIFGQQLILDDGAALGRFITHYRDEYFQVSFNGFDYDLLPGGEVRILNRLSPYWFYMDEADYSQLPPLIDVPRIAVMDAKEQKLYDQMKGQMIVNLPEGEVTAANAGACYSKLAQMANGAVYLDDHKVAKIHDAKLDMLEEIVDELDGEPLLVGYEFNHDLDRLRERFGQDMPYLGKGTTSKQEDAWVAAWNRGELPILCAHPQSAGHGLNMQEGQAYNVAWFSVTWDWENYDQFIRRVRRSGNDNARIFNHILIVQGTIDELKLAAVREKDFTESRLLSGLNTVILRDTAQEGSQTGDIDMVAKLSRPEAAQQAAPANGWGTPPAQQAAPAEQPQQQPQQQAASGWGPVGGQPAQQQQQPVAEQQRQQIQEAIAPQPDRANAAAAAFSGDVAAQTAAVAQGDYGEMTQAAPQQQPAQQQAAPAASSWGTNIQAPDDQTVPFTPDAPKDAEPDKPVSKMTKPELLDYINTLSGRGGGSKDGGESMQASRESARAQVVAAVVNSSPDSTVPDIVEIARELMDFVIRG